MEIGISEFKAKSLKLIDEIHHSGESITVTKRRKPIAKVIPISDHTEEIDLKGTLIEQDKNIFNTDEKWDANL
ncbi:MAG: type II toxin-antitoxin system prevent-host-death family antitoxin [Candidatus Brocadiaceae bacterium]|nr:type II toxin-antitoxin system prevent-host-death family antitoxin [Candidatus Brocadiaceae bacterium]